MMLNQNPTHEINEVILMMFKGQKVHTIPILSLYLKHYVLSMFLNNTQLHWNLNSQEIRFECRTDIDDYERTVFSCIKCQNCKLISSASDQFSQMFFFARECSMRQSEWIFNWMWLKSINRTLYIDTYSISKSNLSHLEIAHESFILKIYRFRAGKFVDYMANAVVVWMA